MGWFREPTECEKWAVPAGAVRVQPGIGLSAPDERAAHLYGQALPRHAGIAKPGQDRPLVNRWLPPVSVMDLAWRPGQIILGKLGGVPLGHLDDRPLVTIAGARAGKTSTVLEPNLCLYPGSMVVLDPKGELAARTAKLRAMQGHRVHVLDPFGQAGLSSSCFNLLSELDPASDLAIDDVATLTQAIIVDDSDHRSQHWNSSARTFLQGLILFTLTLPKPERTLVTMRQLLSLTQPRA